MLFDNSEYPFPVLAAALRASAMNDGRVNVIDFRGSLGSTYRQCRSFLKGATSVRWWVVEQAAFVAAGRREFSNPELHFEEAIRNVPEITPNWLILASSVLQYVEDPYSVLKEFERIPACHLIIDRTPFSDSSSDLLVIQHVPKHIYNASYPCWILSRSRLLAGLSSRWKVMSDFACDTGKMRTDEGMSFEYRGLIFEKLP